MYIYVSFCILAQKEVFMNPNLVFYKLSHDDATRILQTIEEFNQGRTDSNGIYCISLSTEFRPYYILWRLFPSDEEPILIRTLAVTFEAAVERACTLLQNCNVKLEVRNSLFFESFYGTEETIIPFGKYSGKRLAEILYIEPSYILWLANKFTSDNPRFEHMLAVAKKLAVVHYELTVQKRHISSASKHVGTPGEHLKNVYLSVLNVKIQVDGYKPDFYVDQSVLAVDRDGNRFTFLVKAAGKSMTPKQLSCHSRVVKAQETLHLRSAKIMSHYESHGVQYTRLGYVKLM